MYFYFISIILIIWTVQLIIYSMIYFRWRSPPPRTRGSGRGLGEAGEVFPVPVGREEGWGRQGKGCRDHRAGRRVGRGWGSVPGTSGPGGGVGEAGEGVPRP